ncbi:MAG: putative DNA binding domain-containing protein [Gammaproteobacteria bacterium]|nr:putative DNA binding domain-containing protein [Gammaproteobacteria bacterium]
MTIDQITALTAAGESETLEFKKTTGTRREATRTVCGFLNKQGGKVLFGVTSTGVVVGQHVSERTIEELSAELRQIYPPAFPTIEQVPVHGDRQVIVVSTDQGTSKPYTYRRAAYRRVGNTTVKMSEYEYEQMLMERMHKENRWENQLAPGWSIDDLDIVEIRHTVAEAVRLGRLDEPPSREPMDLLLGLGLLQDGVLLRAAVVLFGKEKRLTFEVPQCKLRVARFRGSDKMEFLDNRQFHGNAFSLLSHAERFLRDSLPIAARFEPDSFYRIDEPLYPPPATREALANALCHRDYTIHGGSIGVAIYADRLEVTSPGSLHFGMTTEKLFEPHESRPWNPLIAHTFYRRGVIEEWGGGIRKMVDLVNEAKLPPLEIEGASDWVAVRFRHGQFVPQLLVGNKATERQQAILSLLDRAGGNLALREIRTQLGPHTNERQLREDLAILKSSGLIIVVGHGRGARWKRL